MTSGIGPCACLLLLSLAAARSIGRGVCRGGGIIPAVVRIPRWRSVADLNRFLSDNLALALGVLGLLVLLLLVLSVVQSVRLRRATGIYRALVSGEQGGSLQELLDGHIGRVEEVSGSLKELIRLVEYLEQRTRGSLQHIGLVRFNPFADTGSDQSFAIALLDDRRDGVVISSLHGRANTRVFAKPVENGTSRHQLSDEEREAIRIAVDGTTPIPTAG